MTVAQFTDTMSAAGLRIATVVEIDALGGFAFILADDVRTPRDFLRFKALAARHGLKARDGCVVWKVNGLQKTRAAAV